MDKDKSYRIPGPIVSVVLGCLLTAAISFNAWAVAAVYKRPTEEKVKEMIVDKSPYTRDRSMILLALEDIKSDIAELKELVRTK